MRKKNFEASIIHKPDLKVVELNLSPRPMLETDSQKSYSEDDQESTRKQSNFRDICRSMESSLDGNKSFLKNLTLLPVKSYANQELTRSNLNFKKCDQSRKSSFNGDRGFPRSSISSSKKSYEEDKRELTKGKLNFQKFDKSVESCLEEIKGFYREFKTKGIYKSVILLLNAMI